MALQVNVLPHACLLGPQPTAKRLDDARIYSRAQGMPQKFLIIELIGQLFDGGSLTRRNRAWNRGSDRSGSNAGRRRMDALNRASKAVFSRFIASSRSPSPT